MTTDISQISPQKYECSVCLVTCFRKSEWLRHIRTDKHKNNQNGEIGNILTTNISPNACTCGKHYKDRAGLWRHKKKCSFININQNTEIINKEEPEISSELILNIIQQNQEFKDLLIEQNKQNLELQKQMLEVCKNGTSNINNVNNIINPTMNNSNNKTFNLQVFLNETCKDAMNIMDFVDSIKISLSDIESIGELGFVNGMSKLIIKNLNALDENMRPVHCNDLKRSSLFVKDANVWAKEDDNNNKLKKAIKSIAHKNICALPEWRKKYPDCIYSESKKSDQYNHIVIEAMGGSGDNDDEKADKIISKIAKTITIDKNNR
jgi:hypothetical protein